MYSLKVGPLRAKSKGKNSFSIAKMGGSDPKASAAPSRQRLPIRSVSFEQLLEVAIHGFLSRRRLDRDSAMEQRRDSNGHLS